MSDQRCSHCGQFMRYRFENIENTVGDVVGCRDIWTCLNDKCEPWD